MSKVVSIFLSSSFQDMHAERDYLRRHAFATLRTELIRKGVELRVLDLRGTTADPSLLQEEAVLRLCLQGIENCVPRMVALLGDRYGWIPYGEGAQYEDEAAYWRAREAVANIHNAPGLDITDTEIESRSVTHLEIHYGFKRMEKEHMFFYRRRMPPYDTMQDATRAMFTKGKARQDALLEEIRAKMQDHPDHIKTYDAGWDAQAQRVIGLQTLNDMVYADLRESLELLLSREAEEDPARPESYARALALRSATLTGKEGFALTWPVKAILRACARISNGLMLITGAPGSGISTAMAQASVFISDHWNPLREKMHCVDWISDADDATIATLMAHIAQRVAEAKAPLGDAFQSGWQQRLHAYSQWLDATDPRRGAPGAPKNFRREHRQRAYDLLYHALARPLPGSTFVLFLHDLHQVPDDRTDEPDLSLSWLEGLPLEHVIIVCSAYQDTLRPYLPCVRVVVPPIGNGWMGTAERPAGDIAQALMTQFAAEYGKSFHPAILTRLRDAFAGGDKSPLYARVLADFLMNMTDEEYHRYAGEDAHLAFMHAQLDNLPQTRDGLYRLVAERAQAEYGQLARYALGILVFIRMGISWNVFGEALAQCIGEAVEDATLYALYGYLLPYMQQSAIHNKKWMLRHECMREALIGDYSDEEHGTIALHIYEAVRALEDYREPFFAYAYLNCAFAAGRAEGARAYIEMAVRDNRDPLDALYRFGREVQGDARFYGWVREVVQNTKSYRCLWHTAPLLTHVYPVVLGDYEAACRCLLDQLQKLANDVPGMEDTNSQRAAAVEIFKVRVDTLYYLSGHDDIFDDTERYDVMRQQYLYALQMYGRLVTGDAHARRSAVAQELRAWMTYAWDGTGNYTFYFKIFCKRLKAIGGPERSAIAAEGIVDWYDAIYSASISFNTYRRAYRALILQCTEEIVQALEALYAADALPDYCRIWLLKGYERLHTALSEEQRKNGKYGIQGKQSKEAYLAKAAEVGQKFLPAMAADAEFCEAYDDILFHSDREVLPIGDETEDGDAGRAAYRAKLGRIAYRKLQCENGLIRANEYHSIETYSMYEECIQYALSQNNGEHERLRTQLHEFYEDTLRHPTLDAVSQSMVVIHWQYDNLYGADAAHTNPREIAQRIVPTLQRFAQGIMQLRASMDESGDALLELNIHTLVSMEESLELCERIFEKRNDWDTSDDATLRETQRELIQACRDALGTLDIYPEDSEEDSEALQKAIAQIEAELEDEGLIDPYFSGTRAGTRIGTGIRIRMRRLKRHWNRVAGRFR